MALLDWFKPRPLWQHTDSDQRLAGVRQIGSQEQELLASLARSDADPRVRRAAVQRLTDLVTLAEVARDDSDGGVRGEAVELLLLAALHRQDPSAETALLALSEPRHLVAVAKDARLTSLRAQAVARLLDPRALASVAKAADSSAIRLAALERISDPALLAEVALKAEAKDVALGALERVTDLEALQAVAARARCKAASRRAQASLEELARQEAEEAARARARELAAAADAAAAALTARETAAIHAVQPDQTQPTAVAPSQPEPPLPAPAPPAVEPPAPEPQPTRLLELCAAAEALAEAPASTAARNQLASLKTDWALAHATPPADLLNRFEAAVARCAERDAREREQRERAAAANLARLLGLCQHLEALAKAETVPLGEAGRIFRESKEALENPGYLPSKQDRGPILARLKAARAALFPKLQELREADEWTRWANVSIQEELCGRMEALRGREDLPAVAKELQDLQERWKQARQAPKDQAETLWQRFKTARDEVKARVDAYFAEQKAGQAQNLEKKQALCGQAEALQDSTEWIKTAAELQRLQGEWKAIGFGPRRQEAELTKRFRRACRQFFERRKADLERRKGEWAQNLEKKQALIAQVEALQESTAWEQAVADVKRLQGEWKATGSVRRSHSEALWQRFRAACDVVFERYQKRDQLAAAAQHRQREALQAGMEALLASANEIEAADLAGRVQSLLADWRSLPDLPRSQGAEVETRFLGARDQIVAAVPTAFVGTDLDPEANRLKLERLLAKVEALVPAAAPVSSDDLAARLKEALAANTMGGRSAEEARWQTVARDLEAARAACRRVGPAGEAGNDLKRRFDEACRRALEAKKQAGW